MKRWINSVVVFVLFTLTVFGQLPRAVNQFPRNPLAGPRPASGRAIHEPFVVKNSLNALAKLEPNNTYVRAIRANVWEYALRKVPQDERIRKLLQDDFQWLLAALGNKEGWRYQRDSTDWDNSCTQYGVLGIWNAE
jgi:hypothetical protein